MSILDCTESIRLAIDCVQIYHRHLITTSHPDCDLMPVITTHIMGSKGVGESVQFISVNALDSEPLEISNKVRIHLGSILGLKLFLSYVNDAKST